MNDDYELAIKVVIVGDGVVGKSSLIQRYCKGTFTSEYKKTLGVDFLERVERLNSQNVRLMLWDTAGQEEFDALTKAYYRGAQACAIVFSTTDRQSFQSIERWKKKVEFECGEIPTALVQNKMDLIRDSVVGRSEVNNLVRLHKWKLFKTSVKDNVNVDNVFRYLAEAYAASLDDYSEEPVSMQFPNVSCIKSMITDSSVQNPLFSGSSSKYRKHNKVASYFGNGIALSAQNSNYVNHYRYKSKSHLIPLRQHNSTIMLHRQYYPHQYAYHPNSYSAHLQTSYPSKQTLKDYLFKSCRF